MRAPHGDGMAHPNPSEGRASAGRLSTRRARTRGPRCAAPKGRASSAPRQIYLDVECTRPRHSAHSLRTPPRSPLNPTLPQRCARPTTHPTHPRAHDAATPSLRTAADPIHVCTLCTQTAPTQLTVKMLADVPSPNATVVEMVTTEEGQDMPRDEFMVRGARARACARPGRFCARGCGCPHFARQSPTLPARALRRRCRAFLGLKTLIWMLVPPS